MKKFILITGASSGIGAAVARAFAKRGENLILVARRGEMLEALKTEISEFAPQCEVALKICDLAEPQNVFALWDELKDYRLKALVNNAGFGDYGLAGEEDLQKLQRMISLNVTALTLLSHLFVRDYKREEATLVNISSAGGYSIVPRAVSYCASKFYVSALSEGLYHELAADENAKLRVKVLAPAATRTEFGARATGDANYDYDASFKRYHSAEQMAEFLLRLYDSDLCVGAVDRNSFEFTLEGPKFSFAGAKK